MAVKRTDSEACHSSASQPSFSATALYRSLPHVAALTRLTSRSALEPQKYLESRLRSFARSARNPPGESHRGRIFADGSGIHLTSSPELVLAIVTFVNSLDPGAR